MRVAVVGGGVAGLAAAWELERARLRGVEVEWTLLEASERFGGIVETTRVQTAEGAWVLEGGPDSWVAEKPWARELAVELGLGDEVIACNEAEKRTYLWQRDRLLPLPDRMRLMVPEDLRTLAGSPLFSAEAVRAYARERERAAELRAGAPAEDESVASFVRRHFGEEVLGKVAAPLLSGVFGGDVERLSVRATMPAFVRMERESGSLVAALAGRETAMRRPTFESLRGGMGSLVDALTAQLPRERCRCGVAVTALAREGAGWSLILGEKGSSRREAFDQVLLALPVRVARGLLEPLDAEAAPLLPVEASSAVLVALGWRPEVAERMEVPPGFGFLVPAGEPAAGPQMLAGTFVDQKFSNRAPAGGRLFRVFFGEGWARRLWDLPEAEVAQFALAELRKVLGAVPAPDPALGSVRHWPESLPQYAVGHGERMEWLRMRIARLRGLHLLGNGVHGVGVPDLIREARLAARRVSEDPGALL